MTHPPALPASLPADLAASLEERFARGTPANTLRAYARDMAYVTAWKQAVFGAAPAWPEAEAVALRFVLDHARDLGDAPAGEPARATAEALIAADLRRSLKAPAPATLDRRIASWRAFHRMRSFESPFDAPLVRATRQKARRFPHTGRPRWRPHPGRDAPLAPPIGQAGHGLLRRRRDRR